MKTRSSRPCHRRWGKRLGQILPPTRLSRVAIPVTFRQLSPPCVLWPSHDSYSIRWSQRSMDSGPWFFCPIQIHQKRRLRGQIATGPAMATPCPQAPVQQPVSQGHSLSCCAILRADHPRPLTPQPWVDQESSCLALPRTPRCRRGNHGISVQVGRQLIRSWPPTPRTQL